MASLQFMRARGTAPQRETGTGMASRPGTHAPTAPAERDEGHHHNGHPAPHSRSGPDAWIRELAEAAPPLTDRRALCRLPPPPAPAAACFLAASGLFRLPAWWSTHQDDHL